MKNHVAFLLVLYGFLGFSATVATQEKPSALEVCTVYAEWAELIMRWRQSGKDVVEAYGEAPEPEQIQELVTLAYKRPRFNGTEYQDREVADFKSASMVDCMTWDE